MGRIKCGIAWCTLAVVVLLVVCPRSAMSMPAPAGANEPPSSSSWQWGGGAFRGYWDAGARRLAEEAVDSRLGSWAILRSANFEDSVDGDLRRGQGGADAGGGKLDVDCPQSAAGGTPSIPRIVRSMSGSDLREGGMRGARGRTDWTSNTSPLTSSEGGSGRGGWTFGSATLRSFGSVLRTSFKEADPPVTCSPSTHTHTLDSQAPPPPRRSPPSAPLAPQASSACMPKLNWGPILIDRHAADEKQAHPLEAITSRWSDWWTALHTHTHAALQTATAQALHQVQEVQEILANATEHQVNELKDLLSNVTNAHTPETPAAGPEAAGAEQAAAQEPQTDIKSGARAEGTGTSGGGHALRGGAYDLSTNDGINNDLVDKMLRICDHAAWTPISNADGIKIWRTSLPPDLSVGGQVYNYFIDNSRVHEYNEYCKEIKDLEWIDKNTKITWSASARIGPFKERDFVTRVHYRTLPDGSYVVANRCESSTKAPETDKYLRMQIMVGGNRIRALNGDPTRTLITCLTHVNPGGVASTRLGSMIVNSAAATGPIKFINGLRQCIINDSIAAAAAEKKTDANQEEEGERRKTEEDEEGDEFTRLLREQIQADMASGRRSTVLTCPAGIT